MFIHKNILYPIMGNYESYHFYQSDGIIYFISRGASRILLTKLNNDLSINKTSILVIYKYFPDSYNVNYSYSYYNYINNVLYIGFYNIIYPTSSYQYTTVFFKTDVLLSVESCQQTLLNSTIIEEVSVNFNKLALILIFLQNTALTINEIWLIYIKSITLLSTNFVIQYFKILYLSFIKIERHLNFWIIFIYSININ